ncbi:uncharacterized protein LOC116289990 [Actinia tenebrosa]|uniref:Uncharacterized protein LOC116289990 n=1 Tax=Actinia tenebrosa TaxID=6105 RepID=A0A6P8HB22_ACTTE|nr:uncharacterized protein LOC116289990 [Actinia tenebrosa]
MEGPSSSSTATQLDTDPQPGYTARGHKLTQDTPYVSEIKGEPVVQATDRQTSSYPPNHPRNSVHLEKDAVPVTTECTAISKEGDQRLPPKENSFEEPKDGSIKNSHVGSHKDLPKVECIPNNDIDNEDFREPKNTFCTRDNKSDDIPEVNTGDEQTFATEDKSVEQDQSHHQADDIPTNVDQASSSKNSMKKGDRLHQAKNIPTNKGFKGKRKMALIVFIIIIIIVCLVFLAKVELPNSMPCSNISRGDLIANPKLWGLYSHYMIYIGDGDVVHRTGGIRDWFHFKKGRIKREKLADIVSDSSMCTLVIENGSWEGHEPLPVEEIIKRALSAIGQEGFNLLSKNCEHFARECRYGTPVSKQANNLRFILKVIRIITFIVIVLVVLYCLLFAIRYLAKKLQTNTDD